MTVIWLMEMFCGIGLAFSPLVGSLLYDNGGFMLPFVCFGVLFLIFGVAIKLIIPDEINIIGGQLH